MTSLQTIRHALRRVKADILMLFPDIDHVPSCDEQVEPYYMVTDVFESDDTISSKSNNHHPNA